MFENAYLHIGLEKTGTTSIQEFLASNWEKLKENDVCIPRSLGSKNHKIIAAYALETGSRDIAATSARSQGKLETEASVEAFRSTVKTNLQAESETSRARVAIFSSEDLSRLYTRQEVERALELIRSISRNLKVVVFLRRQDLLASSRYYSLILGGSKNTQVFPRPGQEAPRYYDYARNIGLWIDAVGTENIIPVRFPEVPRAEGFNSIDAFCSSLGLNPNSYPSVKRQHESFDAVNQIIMQNFNMETSQFDPKGLAALMTQLAPYNDHNLAHIPSSTQARRFYARFEEDNTALFHRLNAEDQSFGTDFSMYQDQNMRTAFQSRAIRRLIRLLPD